MSKFAKMRFDNSDAYYEAAAQSKVNAPLHAIGRTGASAGLIIRDGFLITEIPKSVKSLETAAVIGSVHRSKSDIPVFVRATERAGLHHTRPLAKAEYFANPYISRIFHEWGAVAVDRKNPNLNGINMVGKTFLSTGQPMQIFTEGTRINEDTRTVRAPKMTAAMLVIQNHVPLIPMAIAGVARDDARHWFISGEPVVAVFGEPIFTDPAPEGLVGRAALVAIGKQARSVSDELFVAQQAALDLAYDIRAEA